MAITAVPLTAPYSMTNAKLTVRDMSAPVTDGSDYTAAVDTVEFTPTTNTSSWTGIGGNSRSGVAPATWTLALGFAQDLKAGSLQRYLHENAGKRVRITLTPVSDSTDPAAGIKVEAVVTLSPGKIGGKSGADTATATATLGVDGSPVFS